MKQNQGFTLTEVMITILVLAIISAIAVPTYLSQTKKAHLNKAHATLLLNVHFMEQYYAQHKTFKKTSTTWPDLSHQKTDKFDISFTSKAKGKLPNRYSLQAIPNQQYEKTENRFIEIDHNGEAKICHKEGKSKKCQAW